MDYVNSTSFSYFFMNDMVFLRPVKEPPLSTGGHPIKLSAAKAAEIVGVKRIR